MNDTREHLVQFRLTQKEWERLQALARAEGFTVNGYARDRALDANPASLTQTRIDMHRIMEDYEYMVLLKNAVAEAKQAKKAPALIAEAEELLHSEDSQWGGCLPPADGPRRLTTTPGGVYGRDHTLTVDLPAMAGVVYQLHSIPAEKPDRRSKA